MSAQAEAADNATSKAADKAADEAADNAADKAQAETLQGMKERRELLFTRRTRMQTIFWLTLGICSVVFLAMPVYMLVQWRMSQNVPVWPLLILAYAALYVALLPMVRTRLRTTEEDIHTLDFDIDLNQFMVSIPETRAEKILRLNEIQLRRYYDLNLSQNRWIFVIGVACMLLGLSVIAATLWLVTSQNLLFNEKVVVAALGAVGSILTNFVAIIYLRMHSATTQSLDAFHSKLVDSYSLLLGNLVASRIEDTGQRWETFSRLALLIVEKDRGIAPESVSGDGTQAESQK